MNRAIVLRAPPGRRRSCRPAGACAAGPLAHFGTSARRTWQLGADAREDVLRIRPEESKPTTGGAAGGRGGLTVDAGIRPPERCGAATVALCLAAACAGAQARLLILPPAQLL